MNLGVYSFLSVFAPFFVTFFLFYHFSFNPRRLYAHSLYHAFYFEVPSTSATINLHSNLVCGVVIKGQETFTLIAVSMIFFPVD